MARALLLAAHGFVLSAHTMVDDERHRARSSTTSSPPSSTRTLGAMTPRPHHPGLAGAPTEVDVVVIGLGITGAGVALDAVTRGLSVLAVDAHDLAFGTSRWSSKLVHGGLRYLATGQVGVAHESAVERGILMEVTAPHLTHAMPMLVPLSSGVTRPPGAPSTRGGLLGRRPAAPRRPAPAPTPCPGRAGSPATEALQLAPAAARATGCAARCSAGTASSRTTPGWSPRSPAPPRRTAPHVRTRARVLSRDRHRGRSCATSCTGADPHRAPPAR